MAIQTFYSAYVGNLRSYIVINEKSQDVPNNRTLLSWSVYAEKRYSHNPFNNFSQTPVQVTINGTRVYNANVNYDLRTVYKQLIASGETYVSHNSDGSKAVPVSLMVDFSSTGTAYGYGKTTATGSMSLTTIARASTFSLSSYSFDFGTNITMTINRNDSSFTHNVEYTQPNGTTTSVSTTATTSATLNIPISLATQIPNATSYVSTITVKTKNSNGTEIGSHTTNVTVVLKATYKPSISALNPTGKNATIGNNTTSTYQYLGGIDKVGTTITASGSNGSTIAFTEYRLLNNSGTQVSIVKINGTGKATFTAPTVPSTNQLFTLQARVADSRARYSDWKSASIKIRSHYYKTPSIWGLTVGRSTSNQNYMIGRVNWATTSVYSAGGTAGQINTTSMVFKYRKKGVTSWTTLTTNTNLNTPNNYTLPFNNTVFASSDTFEFMGEITDKFGNKAQTSIVTVNGSFVHMDFGPKGVGIGKDHSDSNYNLEVGSGGVNSEGAYKLNGSSIQNYQITSDSGYSKHGSSATDFNNYTSTAVIHMSSSAPNNPFKIWGLLFVMGGDGSNCTQLFICRDGNIRMAVRAKTKGNWTDWNKMVDENSINSIISNSLSGYALKSDIPSQTPYSGGNNTSNGYYIIGDYQVAYGSMPISAIDRLNSTRGGSRNFYRAFGKVPYVQVSMDAQGNYLSGMAYVHSVTKTGFTAAIYDSSGFGSTQAQNRLINYLAIGRK